MNGEKPLCFSPTPPSSSQAGRFQELTIQLRRLAEFKGTQIYLRNLHKFLAIIMKAHRMPNYEAHRPAAHHHAKEKASRVGDVSKGLDVPLLDVSQQKFDVSN